MLRLNSLQPRQGRRVLPPRRGVVACHAKAATISEARKLLALRGWNRAWIDGVTERITRRQIKASEEDMKAVLDELEACGLKGAQIEHVCTIAWGILNRQPGDIRAAADYIRQSGVSDPASVIFHNPKLLEYDPDGDELKKGHRARARVVVHKDGGQEKLLVSFYAANAEFNTAPIAPWVPNA